MIYPNHADDILHILGRGAWVRDADLHLAGSEAGKGLALEGRQPRNPRGEEQQREKIGRDLVVGEKSNRCNAPASAISGSRASESGCPSSREPPRWRAPGRTLAYG